MRKGRDTEQLLLDREFAVPGAPPADDAELRIGPPNRDLMRRLAAETGGGFDARVPAILKRTGATISVPASTVPMLIPIAIALLLGEVFVRRRLMGD